MNKMREVKIEKITLNVGAGNDQGKLEKGLALLKNITGIQPVKTFTSKRIPTWGIRPGLPIGCKITLRKEKTKALLVRLLEAKNNVLKDSQFDDQGNISFGIPEYIDIPDAKYDPKIGVMGFEVCITLERPGFRIKRRSIKRNKISKKHKISKEDAIGFMEKEFKLKVGEE
jgi:large subunit ribosomal protein L5